MVDKSEIEKQLQKIGFKPNGWGRGEVKELPNIILPDEEIYECVNGIYEGGFALLIATDIRVLLVDQKPMNYLTVEDMRFDMISEMDYSHRVIGARISISAGDKHLKFQSYNQPRLRKLIGHVQHYMAMAKKQQNNHGEGQLQHLEKLNDQIQRYMLAQQEQQSRLQEQLNQANSQVQQITMPEPVKPDPELSDYLFAQSLLAQHQQAAQAQPPAEPQSPQANSQQQQMNELYAAGIKEIFGKQIQKAAPNIAVPSISVPKIIPTEIHPIEIAYSKLPMALRNRKFGMPQQPQSGVLKQV